MIQPIDKVLGKILNEVIDEFEQTTKHFQEMRSAHEGYAILLEEVDELWEEIKINQRDPNRLSQIKDEAIQVASMAIRLIYDCCYNKDGKVRTY